MLKMLSINLLKGVGPNLTSLFKQLNKHLFTMSENKISQLPWTVDGCQIHAQGVYLLALQSGAPISENKENAKAIVSAMNNTYGCGVNPEAVPDLLTALNELMAWAKSIEGTEVSHGITNTPDSIFSFSRAAIAKAKLI